MGKVLIVDDEEMIRKNYGQILKKQGFSIIDAANAESAIQFFKEANLSAVILDLKMPDYSGIEILKQFKKIDDQIPVIIVTGHGDIPSAVEAIKYGAYDFIVKPPEFSKLIITLKRAIENYELKKQVQSINSTLEASFQWILGKSELAKGLISRIAQVAQSEFSVILEGETGVGKTYIANLIHTLSKRTKKSFVRLDIGVLPESIIESELFGYEKGAFTGADKNKKGFLELADNGTIFIDEIENMSPVIQSKLLSVIEEKSFFPLGTTKAIELDIRIISATNVNINRFITEKRFREDLLYRLGDLRINIPPLRERVEDISFFAFKFLLEANKDCDKNIREISEDALDVLNHYSWPGNIRELKSVIKKAVLFCEEDVIERQHLDFLNQDVSPSDIPLTLKDSIKKAEIEAIKQALILSKGNKTRAATMLSISYRGLLAKIKEYKIK